MPSISSGRHASLSKINSNHKGTRHMTDITEIMREEIAQERWGISFWEMEKHRINDANQISREVTCQQKTLTKAGYTIEQWIEFDPEDEATWPELENYDLSVRLKDGTIISPASFEKHIGKMMTKNFGKAGFYDSDGAFFTGAVAYKSNVTKL